MSGGTVVNGMFGNGTTVNGTNGVESNYILSSSV